MPSKELTVPTSNVDVEQLKKMLLDPANAKIEILEEDPAEVQRRTVERIFAAQSVEELGEDGALKVEQVAGRPFTLQSISWANSEHAHEDGALPIFPVLHVAFLDTGEFGVIAGGGTQPVALLIKLLELDALPIDLRFLVKKSKKNNRPINLLELHSSGDF